MDDPDLSPACIVLTATVQVSADMAFTLRRDTATRYNDYKQALGGWLSRSDLRPMVFVENSGYDLSELKAMAAEMPGRQFEFLSFQCPAYDGLLGKGYGEMLCLQHCLEHSRVLGASGRFLKVTGRYFLRNADEVLRVIDEKPEAELICNLLEDLTWADSRAFGGSRRFLEQYLCPMLGDLNDSELRSFEQVVARAGHRLMGDGGRWALLPMPLEIEGVSGSLGRAWSRSAVQRWKQTTRLKMLARLLGTHPE